VIEVEGPTIDETLPSELGILLPALDEHEAVGGRGGAGRWRSRSRRG
jgi:hypothetical protein